MADLVLIDGDQAMFNPNFGPAIVVVQPGKLTASGAYNSHYAEDVQKKLEKGDEPLRQGVGGRRVCVEGDEQSVVVPGCKYSSPMFPIPGVGTLRILTLPPNCKSMRDRLGGKAVLLKGGQFIAAFDVQVPAMMPPPGPGAPIPDPTPRYTGNGSFVTANVTQMAT